MDDRANRVDWTAPGKTESEFRELVDAYVRRFGGKLEWRQDDDAWVTCHGETEPSAHFTHEADGRITFWCFVCEKALRYENVLQALGEPFWTEIASQRPAPAGGAQRDPEGAPEAPRVGDVRQGGDGAAQRRRRDYTQYELGSEVNEDRLKQWCEGFKLSRDVVLQFGWRWVAWKSKRNKEKHSHGWPLWDVGPDGKLRQVGWHLRMLWRFGEPVPETTQKCSVPDSETSSGLLLPVDLPKPLKKLIVCEGVTDAMAATALGMPAVGRVTSKIKMDGLANLVQVCGNPEVTWLLDNDGGIEGARECGRELATLIGSSVRIARPINDRDIRNYYEGGGTREGLKDAIEIEEVVDPEVEELPEQPERDQAHFEDGRERLKNAGEYAEIVYQQFKDYLRYSENTWWAWDGRAWVRQADDKFDIITAIFDRVQRRLEAEADGNQQYINAARKVKDMGFRDNVLKALKSQPGVVIRADDWDPHPHLLGFQNGVLDLRTLTLGPSDPKLLLRQVVPWDYDANADYSEFVRCLHAIFKDPDAVKAFSRAAGYTVTGDIRERKVFWLKGFTKSGKSMLLRLMGKAVGPACEQILNPDALRENKNRDEKSVQLSKMAEGRRFIHGPEAGANMKLDSTLVKGISGGDPMAFRGLWVGSEGYTCRGHLWVMSNDPPNASGLDDALWARIYAMTTRGSFKDSDDDDPGIEDRLNAMLPAIAVWMAHQAHKYYESGLHEAGTITLELAEEARSATPAVRFAEAYLEADPNAFAYSSEMEALRLDFNEKAGRFEEVRGGRWFMSDIRDAMQLDERQLRHVLEGTGNDRVRVWCGIKINEVGMQRLRAIDESEQQKSFGGGPRW